MKSFVVRVSLAAGLLWAAVGCGRPASAPAADAAAQPAADIAADRQTLEIAVAAANAVVRAAPDCEAVKAALGTTRATLTEIEGRLRTAAARQSLDGLRQQVERVAELCP